MSTEQVKPVPTPVVQIVCAECRSEAIKISSVDLREDRLLIVFACSSGHRTEVWFLEHEAAMWMTSQVNSEHLQRVAEWRRSMKRSTH
jgi:hypothetical protein